ncbi:MAG TPA: phosphatase PAP2 family protein [Bryobacteraceae bacterium]|nr:phosphatase PAP2 family protein [Bryobacteraceae bacterium]
MTLPRLAGQTQGGSDNTQPATPAEAAQADHVEDARDRILYAEETESVKPLVSKLVRNTLLDQKAIWTSRFHIKRQHLPWIAGIAGGTVALIASDKHLSGQLPNTEDQTAWSRRVSNIGATYTTYPLAAGFYLYGAWKDNAKARETGILAAQAATDALIVTQILKVAFGRERPLEGEGDGQFFKGHHSFPSGHAMMSFAFASVVAREYRSKRIVPILAYGFSTLVSGSRFSARKHFASDIVAGGITGWFIGRYVLASHVDHRIHRRPPSELKSWLTPQIAPHFDPRHRAFGVALAWSR